MAITGKVFVTPHAVHQFQSRIIALPYEKARDIIAQAVSEIPAEEWRITSNGVARLVRTRYPFQFRAIIQDGEGELPAVVTILRHGKAKTNRKRIDDYFAADNSQSNAQP